MMDEIGIVSAIWAKRDAVLRANPRLSERVVASIMGARLPAVDVDVEEVKFLPLRECRLPVVRRSPVLRPVRMYPAGFKRRRLPPVVALPVWHVEDIIDAVCKVAGISPLAMIGHDKARYVAYPRHVAIYLTEQSRPELSLPMIARAFGNRDHTTILHAVRRVPLRMMDNRSDSARWYRDAIVILSGKVDFE